MEIVLHVGAHKTASTHLQWRLELSAKPLRQNGVFIVCNSELRKKLEQVKKKSSFLKFLNRIRPVRLWRSAAIYRRYLREAEAADCDRLVISEEMLLGSIESLMEDGLFYGMIHKRLKPVFNGLKGHPVTMMLALRSYDSFLSSAWCEYVRQHGYRRIDDEQKTRLLALQRGWLDVIEDIIRILPSGSQLRVWRYEDFCNNDSDVLACLVGSGNVEYLSPLKWHASPRLTHGAITRLDELFQKGKPTGPEDVKRVGKRFCKKKGFKPYSPWTDEESAILDKRYDEDIARIRGCWPGIMI
jgi:hypothetical protein